MNSVTGAVKIHSTEKRKWDWFYLKGSKGYCLGHRKKYDD